MSPLTEESVCGADSCYYGAKWGEIRLESSWPGGEDPTNDLSVPMSTLAQVSMSKILALPTLLCTVDRPSGRYLLGPSLHVSTDAPGIVREHDSGVVRRALQGTVYRSRRHCREYTMDSRHTTGCLMPPS